MNQGVAFDMSKWKYGPAWESAPSGAKDLESGPRLKLMQGGKVTGGTVFYAKDGRQTYCATWANAGSYDFIWTEMQHSEHNWQDVTDMWSQCPACQGYGPRRARAQCQ